MNLIEKLGGYNSAKSIRDMNVDVFNGDASGVTTHYMGNSFLQEELDLALLEYRRENNIFEVGDLVVSILDGQEFWMNCICKVEGFHKKMAITSSGGHSIHHYEFRHATHEEIKAGHRL